MTHEERDERWINLLCLLPERIEMRGGPYCGAILLPTEEYITDVQRQNGEPFMVGPGKLPFHFQPLEDGTIVLHGQAGIAQYGPTEFGTGQEHETWDFMGFMRRG